MMQKFSSYFGTYHKNTRPQTEVEHISLPSFSRLPKMKPDTPCNPNPLCTMPPLSPCIGSRTPRHREFLLSLVASSEMPLLEAPMMASERNQDLSDILEKALMIVESSSLLFDDISHTSPHDHFSGPMGQ
jgi:hypothetical protein